MQPLRDDTMLYVAVLLMLLGAVFLFAILTS